jgi:hypothetical protein
MQTQTKTRSTSEAKPPRVSARPKFESVKVRNILLLAEQRGLLEGKRTQVIRGRMPAELVAQAKRRTGIASDSKLLEAALAGIALEDDYGEWLNTRFGTVNPDLDLEF